MKAFPLLTRTLAVVITALPHPAAADELKESGNVAPQITRLSAEQEAAILREVKVADGFELSLFATSSAANYPVYLAASPSGDIYVSSDGNSSLDRKAGRGRVIRLRDSDGDGRADETKLFVQSIDSPRGLVWDHDQLIVLHPPDISCFRDTDGDGVADVKKTLIKGIAFGFEDRPADHTTNGLVLGIDGWIYIAGGDFGFMDAVGTDGSRLQHRGGGVIRFRPDGSKLELFSTGTRNILATPISPLLDIFARDNTNDGGGWNVRFHHFTGLEDHGYPRMYINFNDEIVQPLNDYGGGSGCGGTWLDEPGIPKPWNDAPLTCDWGSSALWHHTLERDGAGFRETAEPKALLRIPRATDATVDGMSRIYQASWKGATYRWGGPDVGYIVRLKPKGYTAEPLPDFAKADDAQLIAQLESPSQVRAQAAQRMLLRRPFSDEMRSQLLTLAADAGKPLKARVAALYAVTQRGIDDLQAGEIILRELPPLAADPAIEGFVLRALADLAVQRPQSRPLPRKPYLRGLISASARTRLEALVGAARGGMVDLAPAMTACLGDQDAVVAHTAFQALARLGAADACFAVVDTADAAPQRRRDAFLALMRMHDPKVVHGLIRRLSSAKGETLNGIIAALCRLHHREGEWKGNSWGTRPDTRGPYYQPEPWSESAQIAAALKALLAGPDGPHTGVLVRELQRNRIQLDGVLERMIGAASRDPSLIPALVAVMAQDLKSPDQTIPAAAIALLIDATRSQKPDDTVVHAIALLAKADSADGCRASLDALARLDTLSLDRKQPRDMRKWLRQAAAAFLKSPKLENHHQLLEQAAAKGRDRQAVWADAALLELSSRGNGSPESRELSRAAIEHAWSSGSQRRAQILEAVAASNFKGLNDKVLAAATDADPKVATLAKRLVKQLRIQPAKQDNTPKVGTLKADEVIARIMKTRGDATLGERLFTSQSCAACHTVSPDEVQKGPYLGNIAQTFPRNELATNILDPAASIAQGFATELFTLKDGSAQMGFVTLESADEVKARNIAGQEFSWKTGEIATRTKLPNSLMPAGLVSNLTIHEFASLLDYFEQLAKDQQQKK